MAARLDDAAPRRLLLLRHAKAEPASAPGYEDHTRPLALRGRRQSAAVGEWLGGSAGVAVDVAYVSSALRTVQTWELLAARLSEPAGAVLVTEDLYDAGARDVLDLLSRTPADARTVLVVGHEPVMSSLAALLAGPGSDDDAVAQVRSGIPTAATCVLDVPGEWAALDRAGATLAEVVRAVED
ncbi:putative phosphohistidine phosphatase, SixA [Beutenbergia cavernae DSM 12333]|uniref:Putative phosphohistidine phosphatase, SixA n=1 Tax=Beutenbergia cavernae (strain ATCC BAA-8 / DSM 12333 / CCUG 43141 / JCM 11478 / NBRC 16432 / NCIMB 13614 / HKI 0122) TaxID=471853 RepID=C5BVX0_BEUC1|nr:histidine phosphatase family protein [Beutenbergia cavernae]ACQ80571.1 putative phosphohistidine phosphatase, SixA [Beutenbergia cavernae DSM 12333]